MLKEIPMKLSEQVAMYVLETTLNVGHGGGSGSPGSV